MESLALKKYLVLVTFPLKSQDNFFVQFLFCYKSSHRKALNYKTNSLHLLISYFYTSIVNNWAIKYQLLIFFSLVFIP